MNWTRGLIRLWLVCTLGWLTFSVTIAWTEIIARVDVPSTVDMPSTVQWAIKPLPPGMPAPDYTHMSMDEYRRQRDADARTAGVPADPPAWAKDPYFHKGDIPVDRFPWEKNQVPPGIDLLAKRLAITIGVAAIPPMIVLAFGAMLLWAVRGFARPSVSGR